MATLLRFFSVKFCGCSTAKTPSRIFTKFQGRFTSRRSRAMAWFSKESGIRCSHGNTILKNSLPNNLYLWAGVSACGSWLFLLLCFVFCSVLYFVFCSVLNIVFCCVLYFVFRSLLYFVLCSVLYFVFCIIFCILFCIILIILLSRTWKTGTNY